MSQSLTAIYLHLIFHVKTTSVAIQETDLPRLFAYVVGTLNHHGCTSIQVGGMRDHLHILCRLSATITVADLVEKVKYASNKFLKSLNPMYQRFAWQAGYGAFSVNPKQVDLVREYVANQKMHHRDKDFSAEYLAFLRSYQVEFVEEYVLRD